ncbi:ankyrin repeat domain-containing protein [Brachyspira pilosicoli]|uniref:ankyrin repeat domain-containing protein n=1 Tax=uncultured Brachyspira sp. TaxID=221953 RepID=UPI0025905BF2|nr:ankyrin repeat domain-containing protein [uncultured Brachyspira sp.]
MKNIFFILLALFSCKLYSLTDDEVKFLKACENGKYETVITMLDRKVNVNVTTEDGLTGLMLASHKGYPNIVKLLIRHNADVNIVDNVGYNALIFAASEGRNDIAKMLIKAKININAKNSYGENALHVASYKLYSNVVQTLIDSEIDINTVNNDGDNALMMVFMSAATREEMMPTIEILCKNGIDVNAKDKNGESIIAYIRANYKKGDALIEYLQQYGAVE